MMQAFRGAVVRFKGRLILAQLLGNFLLLLLAAGWLQIPDSHAWQFAFSMLSGGLLVIAFLWLYTATFRALVPCATRPPLWLSWILLAVFVALWWLLLQPIAAGRAHEGLYAGYWNSKSSPWLRHHLGYSSLVAWQERLYDCAQWLAGGLLLPLAMQTCACGLKAGWFGRAAQVYRQWIYWFCVLIAGLGASGVTWALADWTPAAGLAGQTFSIIVRLGAAYILDIMLLCFILGLVAHYLDVLSPADR
jgi:hypothetical protein